MDTFRARSLLQVMIEFFETGNQTTDGVAKMILESDFTDSDFWRQEMKDLKRGVEWSGVRTVEAEVLIAALRLIAEKFDQQGAAE